jgi:hypothetical protein
VALTPTRSRRTSSSLGGESDGYVCEEIGECLLALGRADEAQPHVARAYELLAGDPSLADDRARLGRLRSLGATQTDP